MVFFMVYGTLILISPCIYLCGRKSKRIRKYSHNLQVSLFWGSFITLMNESYMILVVCILINVKILSFATRGLTVMSVLCIVFMTIFIVLPIVLIIKLLCNFDKLAKGEYKGRYGELYEGLNLKAGKVILFQPSFFLFRRVMLAVAVTLVGNILIW